MNTSLTFRNFRVIASGQQIIGDRERQEDSFHLCAITAEGQQPRFLSLLSDGMGGMGDGDIASSSIVRAFLEQSIKQNQKDLVEAIRGANLELRQLKQDGKLGEHAGGTVIALQMTDDGYNWLSIGDSLLYLQHGDKITKLNTAHTWAWELERRVREGEMSAEEAADNTLPREALYAAVSGDTIPAADICATSRCHIGDRLIIASDGLLPLINGDAAALFNDPEIRSATPESTCTTLLNRLKSSGYQNIDNTTLIIIDICPLPADGRPQQKQQQPQQQTAGIWGTACVSEPGDRNTQQDATLVLHSPHATLAVVADGAGGHSDGALASSTAVKTLQSIWEQTLSAGLAREQAAHVLKEAVLQAHQAILNTADGNHKRCGKCALVLIYLREEEYTIVSAGDCRCYQSTAREWELLTHDDSLLQVQLDHGMLSQEEAEGHPDQGILTQALGGEVPPSPHLRQGTCSSTSSFLLCCDGLWNQLPPRWATLLWPCEVGAQSHESVLRGKVAQAIQGGKGKSDNVSAIWVYGNQHSCRRVAAAQGPNKLRIVFLALLLLLCLLSAYLMRPLLQLPQDKQVFPPQQRQAPPLETRSSPEQPQPTPQDTQGSPEQMPDSHQETQGSTEQPQPTPQEVQRQLTAALLFATEHCGGVHDIAFSPDGTLLATAGADGMVRMTRISAQKVKNSFRLDSAVLSLAFSPDGTRLVTGEKSGIVTIFSSEEQRDITVFRFETGKTVSVVTFSPDGHYLAVGDVGNTATLIRQSDGKLILRTLFNAQTRGLEFSPDGKLFASVEYDGSLRLTDTETKEIRLIKPHSANILSLAFSPDNRLLLTGSEDGSAIVTECDSQTKRCELHHPCAVLAVAISPDGHLLATGCTDGTVCLTEPENGKLLAEIRLNNPITRILFSPDGKLLAVTSGHTARIYEIK